jgi:ABC-type sulfate/molybdate transport systems ATPase subunit
MSGPAYRVVDLRWQVAPTFTLAIDALELPLGQTTLLLGPSASGKSTLLRLLGRVEGSYFPGAAPAPLAGQIWLRPGRDAAEIELLGLSERQLMARRLRGVEIGVVFQREGLFAGRTALDNVAWPLVAHGRPADAAEARARELLERVGLPADRDVSALSGGERKRLALARTLGPRPPVLLLDEPFTGLDPRALAGLLDLVAEIAADPATTVVMVSHQREDIERLGEHVVLMAGGRVAHAGPRQAVAGALAAFLEGEPVAPPHPHPQEASP